MGSYAVTALTGQGGMGEVYRAADTRLEQTVAIKVLLAHVADDPDLRQRFEREAGTRACGEHWLSPDRWLLRWVDRPTLTFQH